MTTLRNFDDLIMQDDKLKQIFNKYKIRNQSELKKQPNDVLKKLAYDCKSVFYDYEKAAQEIYRMKSDINRISSLRSNRNFETLHKDFEKSYNLLSDYSNSAKTIISAIERELR